MRVPASGERRLFVAWSSREDQRTIGRSAAVFIVRDRRDPLAMPVGLADPVGFSPDCPAVFVPGLVARTAFDELLGGVSAAPLLLGLSEAVPPGLVPAPVVLDGFGALASPFAVDPRAVGGPFGLDLGVPSLMNLLSLTDGRLEAGFARIGRGRRPGAAFVADDQADSSELA